MAKDPEEWLKQADYDIDTAAYMLKGKRLVYAVFMCHLSVEKALKGLYHSKMKQIPPKTHSLVGLLDRMGIKPPEDIARFVLRLNDTHITTRYPETLSALDKIYTPAIAKGILTKSKQVLKWIKAQF